MTSQSPQSLPEPPLEGGPSVLRCCDSHPDLETLRGHLLEQFAGVPIARVDDEIARARDAAAWFRLPADELVSTVEITVRHNLMLFTGQVPDSSRLDPETHVRQPGRA